ncbi:MAG: nicotinamide mononucleotide transporter [Bacteroidaceae bacterium]|jgi:nicotinamide mononucleotide transporter|nr:nicotinamide mononucleotide transporter [Bacteroidaceae bacterium]
MALEIIGTLIGLVYLWLEYRASIYLWIASIIMPAVYLFVYYDAGLYADFGINIYYLLAAVYGWWVWKYGNKEKQGEELPITRMPRGKWKMAAAMYLVFQLLIAWILIRYTDSNVPWCDAFTTALSMVAMWMLARKYLEQWLVWIVVDVVSVALYLYKGLFFTAGLYALYAIIAVYGYWNWKNMMEQKKLQTERL